MEKNDNADKSIDALVGLEKLDEVPPQISSRFHETLSGLASQNSNREPKRSWMTGSNQFALAASFVLVFAIGVVINLGSNGVTLGEGSKISASSNPSRSSSDVTDDQIQYSGGVKTTPETSESKILLVNSNQNYVDIPMDFYKKIGVSSTWNSTRNLDEENLLCLKKLELLSSVNLIDSGQFNGKKVKAFWSPVTKSSWHVYIVDLNCNPLDKKYVQG